MWCCCWHVALGVTAWLPASALCMLLCWLSCSSPPPAQVGAIVQEASKPVAIPVLQSEGVARNSPACLCLLGRAVLGAFTDGLCCLFPFISQARAAAMAGDWTVRMSWCMGRAPLQTASACPDPCQHQLKVLPSPVLLFIVLAQSAAVFPKCTLCDICIQRARLPVRASALPPRPPSINTPKNCAPPAVHLLGALLVLCFLPVQF